VYSSSKCGHPATGHFIAYAHELTGWEDQQLIRVENAVYDKVGPSDGRRIPVMKMWPRGRSKDKINLWMKDLGTPKELIRDWKVGQISWNKFAAKYKESLKGKEKLLRDLADESKRGTITLLCTDKDPNLCHRSLLKDAIKGLSRSE
jgi:uncharacterized protein YeaO (DUF488 family)